MHCQLFAILALLTATPALAGDLMLYSQDYDDGSGNPQTTINAPVRPGQTITVSAAIYTAISGGGWDSDSSKPATEFSWQPNCDATQAAACPSIQVPDDGSVNVTITVPTCMPKSVVITVSHQPQPDGDQANYAAARMVLTNSEDLPGGCASSTDPSMAGMGGPAFNGFSGPTAEQSTAKTQAQNANPAGAGYGGNGNGDDGWNNGWNNNSRRREYDDEGGFGGGYHVGTPGYNVGNSASAEVEDCAWHGASLSCTRVPDPPRVHVYRRLQRRHAVRAQYKRPVKRPAPARKQASAR